MSYAPQLLAVAGVMFLACVSRLLKYAPVEAAFLRLRGSCRKLYRIVQFRLRIQRFSVV